MTSPVTDRAPTPDPSRKREGGDCVNAFSALDRRLDAVRPGLALAALLALAGAGCGRAAPLVAVDQLLAQCEALKGKPVRLAGYLGECAGYDCHLAADQSHWDAYVSAFNDARTRQSHAYQMRNPQSPAQLHAAWSRVRAVRLIGVGGGKAFDQKAAPFQHSYVVISGNIAADSCDGRGETDRGRGIEPTDIRAWTTSEGAPAKRNEKA